MSEKDAIQEAYFNKLEELYKVMFASYSAAAGDAGKQAAADTAFKAGAALARTVRDRAQALV